MKKNVNADPTSPVSTVLQGDRRADEKKVFNIAEFLLITTGTTTELKCPFCHPAEITDTGNNHQMAAKTLKFWLMSN